MRRFLPIVILLSLFSKRVLAQNQTVANGSATTPIILQGTGCNYRWSMDKDIGLLFGTGNIPSFTAVNTTSSDITAQITVTPLISNQVTAYIVNQLGRNLSASYTSPYGIGAVPVNRNLGANPYGISTNSDASRVFITNQGEGTVSVYYNEANRIITTLAVGDSPKGVAVSPDGTTAYVVNSTDGKLWVIDAENLAVTGSFTIGGDDLTGIAISPDGSRKYITQTGSGTMAVVDASNHLIRTVNVGVNPTGVAVSPDGQRVYVANNGGNSVSIINTTVASYPVTIVPVGHNPFGIVASHDGAKVYVTNQADNTVSCINTSNNSVSTINVGHNPIGISISGDNSQVVVANHDDDEGNVSVIHTADNSVVAVTTYMGEGNFSFGNFIPGGFNCSPVPVTFNITVTPTPPTITATGSLNALTTSNGVASASTSFTFSGLTLPAGVLVSPPPGFEVSTDDINYSSTLTIGTGGNITGTVYVRLAATTPEGTYSGNITLSSGSVSTTIATAPSTVTPIRPVVILGPVSGTTASCQGATIASTDQFPQYQQFTISAVHLTSVLTATVDGNSFEISLRPETGFAHSIDVANVTEHLDPVVMYVRASALAPAGKITGTITLLTDGAATRRATVNATVYPVPVAGDVSDQVLVNGNNTQTVHFTGIGSNTFLWTIDHPEIGFTADNGTGDIPSFRAVNTGTTSITATVTAYPVSTGLIYITNLGLNPNTGGSTVAVINPSTNELIASIPVGSSPKSMAINSAATRLYVANTGTNDISVIDMGTNTNIQTIPVGTNPLGISFNADESQVLVYNSDDGTVSVIDVATNQLIATTRVHDYPPGTIFNEDKSKAYLYNPMDGSFGVVNTMTRHSVGGPLGRGASPGGLALSPDGTRVYVANSSNQILVYNADTYALITTVDVGHHPQGISLSKDGTQLYVANMDDNTISIVNTLYFDVTTLTSANGSIALPSTAISTGGTGCSGIPAIFKITVNPSPPTIVATGTVAPLFTTAGVASPASSFTLSGINLKEGILVSPPTGFEVSVDGLNFFSSLLLGGAGNMSATTIYVRLAASMPVGDYTDNITLTSLSASPVLVPVTGTVAAAVPTVAGSVATGTITACVGSPSVNPNIQQFTVSGFLLTTDATATAPVGFELALDPDGPYTASVTIAQTGGNIAGTVVYVRASAAAQVGSPSGYVQLFGGSIVRSVLVKGIIHPPPTVNQVDPQTVSDGHTLAVNFNGTGNSYSWTNSNPAIGLGATGTGNISFEAVNRGLTDVTADVTVTPHSASLAYIPSSAYVYVEDLATNTQVDKIPLGSGNSPFAVAAAPDGLHVYVVNQGSSSISVINTGSNTVTATIPLFTNSVPSGIAVSPDGTRLYVTNRNNADVSVISTQDNIEIRKIPVGNGPEGIVVSPDGRRVYVVNQNAGTVSIIDVASNQVISSFVSAATPEGIAITPDGSAVYVANYNTKKVTVFNTRTNALSSIDVGLNPSGVAITPDGNTVYVTNTGANSISVISTATNTVIKTIQPTISAPKGISVSPDGQRAYVANYGSNNVTVIDTHTNTAIATIPGILTPIAFGNFITQGSGCDGAQMNFQIIVHPSLTNTSVTGSPSALTTIYGTASASTNFNVAGINMTSGITITPPAGFELSKDNAAFGSTVIIGAAGTIVATPVYIRLAATTAAGSYTGNIKLASSGQTDIAVAMPQSTVAPAPLTITADNKTKVVGVANPAFTAAYAGFVNQEGPAKLTTQPTLSTTADVNSPVGQYPITVSGAAATNYTITYVAGVLTINAAPAKLTVSNAFTPNGDGINDTWIINDLDTYPGCTVAVFNRNGQRVFFSNNYPVPWNGHYGGKDLPSGTYYYIITLGSGFKPVAGYIAIIR